MILSIFITLFPVLFLIVLFGGGAQFRKKNIDMDGTPPINRTAFYISKYTIVVLWASMAIQAWGVSLTFFIVPEWIKWIAIFFWVFGFILLFIGRFGMGNSFRIGSPKESTILKVDGLFRFSRNPMYLGVYSTIFAVILYTLNPILLLVGTFIIAVHHKIVLAEEAHLREVFGEEYTQYCGRVGRYL
jgi:protein-S-isoprenylcysteine O-methyltransferase Ste14